MSEECHCATVRVGVCLCVCPSVSLTSLKLASVSVVLVSVATDELSSVSSRGGSSPFPAFGRRSASSLLLGTLGFRGSLTLAPRGQRSRRRKVVKTTITID